MFPLLTMPLSPTQFTVAMKLADHMDEHGVVRRSYTWIARRSGISRATAIRVLAHQLSDLFEVTHQGGRNVSGTAGRGGANHVNTFRARWKPKKEPAVPKAEAGASPDSVNGRNLRPLGSRETVAGVSRNGRKTHAQTVAICDPISTSDDPLEDPRDARSRARGPLPVEKVKEEEGGAACGACSSLDDGETDRGALNHGRVWELAKKLLPDGPKPGIDSEDSVVEALKRELTTMGSRALNPGDEKVVKDACSAWFYGWDLQRRTVGVRAAAARRTA